MEYPDAGRLGKAIGIFVTARRTGKDPGHKTSSHLTGGRAFSPTVHHGLKIHGNRDITLILLPDKIGCFRVYVEYQIRRAVTCSLTHIDFSRFASRRSSKPLIYFSTYRFIAAMSSNISSRRDAASTLLRGCFSWNKVLTICRPKTARRPSTPLLRKAGASSSSNICISAGEYSNAKRHPAMKSFSVISTLVRSISLNVAHNQQSRQ